MVRIDDSGNTVMKRRDFFRAIGGSAVSAGAFTAAAGDIGESKAEETIFWTRRVPVRYEADVAVIGGGVAGAMAAWRASQAGVETVLLERDREVGVPVRCAEMCSLSFLEKYFPVPQNVIANLVNKSEYITPDNEVIVYPFSEGR